MLRSLTAALSFASLSLTGCATTEEDELPDTLVDGAGDSWNRPSQQGTLFEDTWQYGELIPDVNARNLAYTFSVDDAASITVTTRSAPVPVEDRTLTRSVVYLYKQTDAGTYRRITKTVAGEDFGVLTRNIDEGTYRVLVKGVSASDEGEFMIKLGCTGAGCADGPQCLFGDGYSQLRETYEGAITTRGRDKLTADTSLFPNEAERIIAAVKVTSPNVGTVAEAFDAVDGNEIYRNFFTDHLTPRGFSAYEYGAGDNSFGGLFEANQIVATITDGEITDCTIVASSCLFGRNAYDTRFMPDMSLTGEYKPTRPSEVMADLRSQVIAAFSNQGVTTLDGVFEVVPEPYIATFRHRDGRQFVGVYGGSSDGAIFAKGSTTKLAELTFGGFQTCNEF